MKLKRLLEYSKQAFALDLNDKPEWIIELKKHYGL